MANRLLPIDTCAHCECFVSGWSRARSVYYCTNLQRVICAWETPRPPIPDDCPLEKAPDNDDGDDTRLVVAWAQLEEER